MSCIVGPNGCGKSNIVDALKWCMGEQSAKSLRGGEMLDVIFGGSAERPPMGFAEVSITFTAEEGEPFPGEYARFTELAVGRRLHRTGASEYFLGGNRCRRRDIIELFMDTGVGNNLYSFIEQGSIGKIVHASPAERRTLIDEAAGISKYKIRRKEAQDRLEATGTQLDRAADVADEMGRRLKELERQVIRAAKFRRLRAEQRQDEILLALAKFADLSSDRRRLRREFREAKGRAEQAERMLVRRERELAGRREELELSEQQVNLLRDELAELDASLREVQGAQGFAERRVGELEAEKARWTREAAEALAGVEAATAEEAGQIEAVAARQAELDELTAREPALREALRIASADRGAARQVLAEAEGEVASLAAKLGAGRARAEGLAQRAEAIPAQEAGLRAQIEEAQSQAEAATAREAEVDAAIKALGEQIAQATSEEDALSEKLTAARTVERQAQDEATATQRALEQAETEGSARVDAAEKTLRDAEAERARLAAAAVAARREGQAQARRAHADRLKQAENTWRSRVDGARRRSEQWLSAAQRTSSRQTERRRQRLASERASLDARARELRETAERQTRSEREAALAALAEAQSAERSELDARLREGRERLEAARTAAREANRAHREAEQAEAEARGSLSAASARLRDLTAAAAGSGAVAEALSELPSLGDLVELDAQSEAVLGDRLSLKVASDPEDILKAARAAREGGTGRALFVPRARATTLGDEAVGQIDRALERVATLEEALQAFAFSGRAAVVTETGEAVLADGVVLLGGSGEGARAAVEAKKARDASRTALAEAQARVEATSAAKVVAEEALQSATEAVDAVSEQLGSLKETHAAARAEVLAESEKSAESRRQAAAAEAERARVALAEAEARADAEETSAQRELVELRAAAATVVESERAEADAHRQRAAEISESALESQLEVIDSKEAAAGPPLEPLREGVARARQEAREQVAEARTRLAERRQRESEARAAREAVVEERRRVSEHKAELELERAARGADRVRIRGEGAALAARVSALEAQIADLHREASRVAGDRAEAADVLAQLQERQGVLQARVDEARAVLDGQEGREEESREALSRWQRDLAGAQERLRAAKLALEALERRVREAAAARLKADERLAASETEQTEIAEEATALAAKVQVASESRAAAWDKLEREREKVKQLREAWHEVEEDLRRLMTSRDENAREVASFEVRVSEVQVEVDALKQRIDERYQLSLPGLLDRMEATGSLRIDSDPLAAQDLEIGGQRIEGVPPRSLSPGDLHDFDAIRELVDVVEARREKITRLGDVHLGALEEYRELETRHADLVAQRTDLEESMASIRAAIAKMNRTSRQRFRDAFDRVDEHFQELYPRLVGGGRARLSLTDEDDLLETGVDIFVQPPGKRLQNLTLLSGGEKAMAAIALLMSLFKVRPSPFCVLDEVDAPLDEANGGRFNEMIREMSVMTQFLVVTHNKKTMESGDTLYGITMPTPGASRVVSVRIDDADGVL